MKSSHKMVVTGALGGLTAAVVAASGAFACTPTAQVGIKQHDSFKSANGNDAPAVPAGSTMVYKVRDFYPQTDDNPWTITVELYNPFTKQWTVLGSGPGPEFEQPIFIPKETYSSTGDAGTAYVLRASQVGSPFIQSTKLFIADGIPYVAPPSGGSTAGDPQAPAAPRTDTQIASTASSSVTPGAQDVVAAPQAAEQAAAIPAATGDALSGERAGAGAAIGQVALPPIPLAPPAPPENATPPAAELWSGLKADSSVNLLDPAAGTTPLSDGVPTAGLALLGSGILSLAGVAFESTRRRLVLSRVARRR